MFFFFLICKQMDKFTHTLTSSPLLNIFIIFFLKYNSFKQYKKIKEFNILHFNLSN